MTIPVLSPFKTHLVIPFLLSIRLGIRESESGHDDRKVLKRKILSGQMKAMPVGKGRCGETVPADGAALIDSDPVKGRAARGLYPPEGGAGCAFERPGNLTVRQSCGHFPDNPRGLFRLPEEDPEAGVTVPSVSTGTSKATPS